jgi:alpha-glucosidase
MRWLWADDDAVAYLREAPEERLLCVAARAPHAPLRLPARVAGLRGRDVAANLYGGAPELRTQPDGPGGIVQVDADGPTFQVWQVR